MCGNLLPLRPLVDQIMPPFRSIYNWYTNRSVSCKTSEKSSSFEHSLGRFGRSGVSPQPRIEHPPRFEQTNLKPTSTSGRDLEQSTSSDQYNVASAKTPMPAYPEKTIRDFEEDREQEVQITSEGMTRKTVPAVSRSQWVGVATTACRNDVTHSTDRSSRDGSESGLMPPARERLQRNSGPWSYALALLNRR